MSPSDEMRRAAELLPGMIQRYRGAPMDWDAMRADDAREAPDVIRSAHTVVDELSLIHI